jgi:DNA-binding response OmpR family regulator
MHKRALVVDNEPVSREQIEKVLHSVGIESLVLNRSSEAPNILRESKFRLLFLVCEWISLMVRNSLDKMRYSGFNRMTPVVLI